MNKITFQDYIHHGMCGEIFSDKHIQDAAKKELSQMGVDLKTLKSPSDICEALSKKTCKIVTKPEVCKSKHGLDKSDSKVVTVCGGKETCWNLNELDEKLQSDEKFAARFSQYQLKKYATLKKVRSATSSQPCYLLTGDKKRCMASDGRCLFHERTLIGTLLFDSARRYNDRECYMNPEYYNKLHEMDLETTYKLTTLQNALLDYHINTLQRNAVSMELLRNSTTIYDNYRLRGDLETLESLYTENVKKMDKKTVIEAIKSQRARAKSIGRIASSLQYVAQLVGARYVDDKFIEKVAGIAKVRLDENNKVFATSLIQISLFVVENLFITWSLWFFLFPAGREALKKMLRDPSIMALFVLSLKISGLKDDTIFPNIEKVAENVSIQVDIGGLQAQVTDILRVAGSTVVRGLKDMVAPKKNASKAASKDPSKKSSKASSKKS